MPRFKEASIRAWGCFLASLSTLLLYESLGKWAAIGVTIFYFALYLLFSIYVAGWRRGANDA